MKKSTYILFTCISVVICIIPFLLMGVRKTTTTSENKTLAEKPSFIAEDGSINLNYTNELSDYFLDRFAFRQELVSLNGTAFAKLLNTSTVDDVIKGTNDWLYYKATLDDFRHDNSVSERMLYNMAHNIKLMQDYCVLQGSSYVFTIAPNKNSLYGDNMPARYKYHISEMSDAERLTPYLKSEGVNYVDMYELFKNQDEVLYYKKDSHWNNKGAVLAYNALLDAAGKEHETYEGITPVVVDDYVGDLNRMLYADLAVPETDYKYAEEFPFAYINPESTVEDMTIETINPLGEGSLLIYRDSFGNTLLPYMASAFEKAYFSKVVPYPMTDMELTMPDVVIVEKVERHLPTLAQVVPQMEATMENSIDDAGIEKSDKVITIDIKEEGPFIKISGSLTDEDIDVDSPIYVKIDNKEESNIYNAFCVSSKAGDYDFAIYLNSEEMAAGEMTIIGIKDGEDIGFSTETGNN